MDKEIYYQVYENLIKFNKIDHLLEELFNYTKDNIVHFSPMWHAIGFIHCQLFSCEKGNLRVHIWPKNKRDNSEQKYKIHDHIFSLNSYVVCGEIENTNYELIEQKNSQKRSYQLYKVKYHTDGSSLHPSNRFFEIKNESKIITAKGEIYGIERGIFHDHKIKLQNFTTTIVATYNHNDTAPRMLGDPQNRSKIFRKRVSFPLDQWQELLINTLQYI